jgi:hypothetical protein
MLEPVRPEAVLPDRALCLPTFSHLLIVNKTALSLSLSLSLARSLALVATYKVLESFVSNKLSLSLVQRVCM